MGNITRVKVELRGGSGKTSAYDADKQFRAMHSAFKRAVSDEGIITLYKQKQIHETKGQKRRRKMKAVLLTHKKEQSKLRKRDNR